MAVTGTMNTINAAVKAGVRRFVFTSSIGAVHMNPNRSSDTILDEKCWSDPEYCKKTDVCLLLINTNIYFLSLNSLSLSHFVSDLTIR